MSAKIVKVVKAFENETIEIQWRLTDGTTFVQRVEIPPLATRQALDARAHAGAGEDAAREAGVSRLDV